MDTPLIVALTTFDERDWSASRALRRQRKEPAEDQQERDASQGGDSDDRESSFVHWRFLSRVAGGEQDRAQQQGGAGVGGQDAETGPWADGQVA